MSPELEELLQAARTEEQHLGPTFDDRQRVRQKLRLALGGSALFATSSVVSRAAAEAATGGAVTSVVAGTAAEAGALGGASFLSGVSGLKLAGWLLVGSALGLGGAWTSRGLLGVEEPAGPLTETRAQGPSEAPGTPERGETRRAPREPDEGAPPAPEPPVSTGAAMPGSVPLRAAQPRAAAAPPARGSTAVEREVPRENILEESRRLKAAQAALSRGDLGQAQAELDATSGALLEPERLGLEAITACRRGEEAAARRLEARVLAAYPSAPIVSRLRRELASGCRPADGKTSTDPGTQAH